jgi:hypothetical protein
VSFRLQRTYRKGGWGHIVIMVGSFVCALLVYIAYCTVYSISRPIYTNHINYLIFNIFIGLLIVLVWSILVIEVDYDKYSNRNIIMFNFWLTSLILFVFGCLFVVFNNDTIDVKFIMYFINYNWPPILFLYLMSVALCLFFLHAKRLLLHSIFYYITIA